MKNVSEKSKLNPVTTLSFPSVGVSQTGLWRTFRPVVDYTKCTNCVLCWIYCPDAAITRHDNDSPKIDYDYCKGCGICAHECPTKAIAMKREKE